MYKVSWWKKLKLFLDYKRAVDKIEKPLLVDFNTRVDGAYRLYTVINIPQELVEEPYNLRRTDIDAISQNFIREYSTQISRYLNSQGLSEMYDFYDVTKVDKYSYLVIIGFSLFNTQKFYTGIFYVALPIVGILTLILSLIILK